MVKKPKAVTLDVLGTSGTVDPLAQTFTLSDTGTFSKDMFSIDSELMGFADFFLFMIATLAFTLAIVAIATPLFLVAAPPLLGIYVYFVQTYRKVSRETKRLESLARSPVFAHYSESLGGTATIRAYAVERRFTAANMRLVDALNEAYYINKVADRWLSVRLETLPHVQTP